MGSSEGKYVKPWNINSQQIVSLSDTEVEVKINSNKYMVYKLKFGVGLDGKKILENVKDDKLELGIVYFREKDEIYLMYVVKDGQILMSENISQSGIGYWISNEELSKYH